MIVHARRNIGQVFHAGMRTCSFVALCLRCKTDVSSSLHKCPLALPSDIPKLARLADAAAKPVLPSCLKGMETSTSLSSLPKPKARIAS